MTKKILSFLIKYIIPSLTIELLMIARTYYNLKFIAPFGKAHIIIFLGILFLVSMYWAFLYYIQDAIGEFMDETWIGKIAFVLVAAAVFYLFKVTGKI